MAIGCGLKPTLRRGGGVGLLCVLLPATLTTAHDTWRNPAELFRREGALNVAIVWETWWSWAWPLALLCAGLWLGWEVILRWRLQRRKACEEG